jgi:protein-S-isoprenylcysteine O-methyltransferase Ste14
MSRIAAMLRSNRALDLVEQVTVTGLYCWLVARMWPEDFSPSNWFAILLLMSEGLIVALLLVRRPTEHISRRLGDWAMAVMGTFVVLLVAPGGPAINAVLGLSLMLAGLVVHLGAKLSLWRSFGLVAANRGVKTKGLYAMVRHPMYAGYMLSHAGFLLSSPSWWNLAIYAMAWTLLIARIEAEEKTLRGDAQYTDYMQRVRYRLAPGLY